MVWAPANGFYTYNFPAPHDKPERIVAIVRGMVQSQEAARATHNAIVSGQVNKARMAGSMSHEVYFRLAAPDAPERLELFAVDVWTSVEGIGQYYQDPEFVRGFHVLFPAPPSTSTWVHPAGDWVEW